MTLKVCNDNYVASKFERLFEEKLISYFKNNGIDFVKMLKFGHNEDDPEFELKYDIYIKHTDEEKWNKIEEELGLVYAYSSDGYDAFTYSFQWSDDLYEDCNCILESIGVSINDDLYRDTVKYLSEGIPWGELEFITP